MENNFLSICKNNPLELESSILLSNKAAVYALCIEDLLLTAVPNTLFLLFVCSSLCPMFAQLPSHKTSLPIRLKIGLCFSLWLSIFPILELFYLLLNSSFSLISLYYILTESASWAFTSLLVYAEEVKKVRRSFLLYVFWGKSLATSLIKGATRFNFEVGNGKISYILCLHLLEIVSNLGVFLSMSKVTHSGENKIGMRTAIAAFQMLNGLILIHIPKDFSYMWIGLVFSCYMGSFLSLSSVIILFYVMPRQNKLGKSESIIIACILLAVSSQFFIVSEKEMVWMMGRILQGFSFSVFFHSLLRIMTHKNMSFYQIVNEVSVYSSLGLFLGGIVGGIFEKWAGFLVFTLIILLVSLCLPMIIGSGGAKSNAVYFKWNMFGRKLLVIFVMLNTSIGFSLVAGSLKIDSLELKPFEKALFLVFVMISYFGFALCERILFTNVYIGLILINFNIFVLGIVQSLESVFFVVTLIGALYRYSIYSIMNRLNEYLEKNDQFIYIYDSFYSAYAIGYILGTLLAGCLCYVIGIDNSLIVYGLLSTLVIIFLSLDKSKNESAEGRKLLKNDLEHY